MGEENIYNCDHFVYDEYKLVNIVTYSIIDTVYSEKQIEIMSCSLHCQRAMPLAQTAGILLFF